VRQAGRPTGKGSQGSDPRKPVHQHSGRDTHASVCQTL